MPSATVTTIQDGGAKGEQQTITLTDATGGTFCLSWVSTSTGVNPIVHFGFGSWSDVNKVPTFGYAGLEVTVPIAWNASAATVESALEGLAAIGVGDVSVSGPAGGPWVVEFTGSLADADQPMIIFNDIDLTDAGIAITVTTQVDGTGATTDVPYPTHLWHLNEATEPDIRYDDIQLLDLSENGDVSYGGGKIHTFAAEFDYFDGYYFSTTTLTRSHHDNLTNRNAYGFSIAFWFKIDRDLTEGWGDPLDLFVVSKADTVRDRVDYNFEVRYYTKGGAVGTGTGYFVVTVSESGTEFAAIEINDDTWYFAALTISADGLTAKLYLNGTLEETKTLGSAANWSSGNFVVGGESQYLNVVSKFIGQIEELIVWQGVILQAAVTELWNSGNGKEYPHGTYGTNELQTFTFASTPTRGSYTLTFDGETTAPIPWNSVSSAVWRALSSLSNIDPGDVSVIGGMPGPFNVVFRGQYEYTNVSEITADGSNLGVWTSDVSETRTGSGPINEIQKVTIAGANGGTFTLTYEGETTTDIVWSASIAEVEAALEALSTIGSGNVSVAAGSYVVTFISALGNTNLNQMTANGTNLWYQGAGGIGGWKKGNPGCPCCDCGDDCPYRLPDMNGSSVNNPDHWTILGGTWTDIGSNMGVYTTDSGAAIVSAVGEDDDDTFVYQRFAVSFELHWSSVLPVLKIGISDETGSNTESVAITREFSVQNMRRNVVTWPDGTQEFGEWIRFDYFAEASYLYVFVDEENSRLAMWISYGYVQHGIMGGMITELWETWFFYAAQLASGTKLRHVYIEADSVDTQIQINGPGIGRFNCWRPNSIGLMGEYPANARYTQDRLPYSMEMEVSGITQGNDGGVPEWNWYNNTFTMLPVPIGQRSASYFYELYDLCYIEDIPVIYVVGQGPSETNHKGVYFSIWYYCEENETIIRCFHFYDRHNPWPVPTHVRCYAYFEKRVTGKVDPRGFSGYEVPFLSTDQIDFNTLASTDAMDYTNATCKLTAVV